MSQHLHFGRIEVRPAERVLRVDGQAVVMGARAFDVLLALIERRDRVVTKNELLDLAWPGLVVEENNLSVQISALRKALGAGSIATVTGRGYRLALESSPQSPPAATEAPASTLTQRHIARRLAVILSAEVIGWQRLVARDAIIAVQAWQATRQKLIEPTVAPMGGRLLELTPDRVLIEFASAIHAVDWALSLQAQLADRRATPPHGMLRMRIGISVDDVIVDDGKLVGDGVNIASEVRQVAGHDEVLITETVHGFVAQRMAAQCEDLGQRSLRFARSAMNLFRVTAPATAADGQAKGSALQPRLQWDRLPSLAVLPMWSDGPEADRYFGDGVTEEIIASLSLNRALFVIAHSSTLRFRNRRDDPAEVAAELGVRYLLLGTVRRAGQRLRLVVELVHAAARQVIWQDHYEGTDDDVFDFQARIASSIAAAIDPRVLEAELARMRSQPTGKFSAYDSVLRGQASLYLAGQDNFNAAGEHFQQAVALDEGYAQAHTHLAWWFNLKVGEGRSSEVQQDRRLALEHAMHAMQLDPRDALVLSVAGHLLSFLQKRFAEAMEIFDQAIAINPNCAVAWARSATTLAYLGRGEEALERARNAMRLSPFDRHSFAFFTTCGTAAFVAGRPDEAIAWLGKAMRLNPNYNAARRILIASLALTGEVDEARALADELMSFEPSFTVEQFGSWYPMQEPHLERLLAGLRQAGLPA